MALSVEKGASLLPTGKELFPIGANKTRILRTNARRTFAGIASVTPSLLIADTAEQLNQDFSAENTVRSKTNHLESVSRRISC